MDYALGLYEKAMDGALGWAEKLSLARESGFDYVEISIDETDGKLARLEPENGAIAEIAAAMAATGVPIRSMCLSGHRKYPLGSADPDVARRGLDIMQKAVDFAAALGIRIIQLAGYDVYYEPSTPDTVARFAHNLRIATDMAALRGVMLGFETMETPFMDTVGKAMAHVRRVDSPYLHVYPDSGNCMNAARLYGHDVLADLESGRGHIVAVHLKETVPGRYREVPFGTGHVPFEDIIWASWQQGVRMYVAEFWKVDDAWAQELRRANAFIRRAFDAALSRKG